MIFYLHYILLTSGLCGISVLLGVFIKAYSDASQSEIGALLMSFPFILTFIKPLFCSMADRQLAHRGYLIGSLIIMLLGYLPFIMIPFWEHFYQTQPRLSWYAMVVACLVGNGALGVAWSLGDTLAINHQQKTGVPYSRMRLVGTVSWGVYGYVIGLINEVEGFPKYVPAFLILYACVILEILALIFWKKEDFEMYDPLQDSNIEDVLDGQKDGMTILDDMLKNMPSSLGGTLRGLRPETTLTLRDTFNCEIIRNKLKAIESVNNLEHLETCQTIPKKQGKNPQLVLLKMFLKEDGRLSKYFIIFTLYGILFSPMSFLFISMEELCDDGKECNFSRLSGYVLVSQATIETLGYLFLPLLLRHFSRSLLLGSAIGMMFLRFSFYGNFYYSAGLSPYWTIVAEWGHGLSYTIVSTILAEASLMFADQSRLFIDELRSMGYMSNPDKVSKAQVKTEENSIKMALRATMQALFSGFYEGIGLGIGSLLCGVLIDAYSYGITWNILAAISLGTILIHQLAELTRSRWSDTYRPEPGTKGFEIMTLSQERQRIMKCQTTNS